MSIAVEAAAVAGGQYIWCAPTYDQVRTGWNETRKAAGAVADFNIGTMTATFPRGGTIIYRSLDDPDNARGKTADGVVIDECADVVEAAWYEVLRPMLIDTNGWAWGIGTPKGRNWFWREHQRGLDHPDVKAWQAPTLGAQVIDSQLVRVPHPLENPEIPWPEMLSLWESMPERSFRQEILAEFMEGQGGVFRRVTEAATAKRLDKAADGHEYVFGVDWGKSNDWTVVSVLDASTRHMVYLDRFHQIDYALQTSRLKALAERFRPQTIIAERNSMGEPLIETLLREGLPVQPFLTTNATKTTAIDALALAFERGELVILDEPVLVGELQAYEAERLPSGLLRYGAPEGMHDDCVMSLALAWQGVAMAAPLFAWDEAGEDD